MNKNVTISIQNAGAKIFGRGSKIASKNFSLKPMLPGLKAIPSNTRRLKKIVYMLYKVKRQL